MRSKIAVAVLIGLFGFPGKRAQSHTSPTFGECTINDASEDDDLDDADEDASGGMDFSSDSGATFYISQPSCELDDPPAALADIRRA